MGICAFACVRWEGVGGGGEGAGGRAGGWEALETRVGGSVGIHIGGGTRKTFERTGWVAVMRGGGWWVLRIRSRGEPGSWEGRVLWSSSSSHGVIWCGLLRDLLYPAMDSINFFPGPQRRLRYLGDGLCFRVD